MESRKRRSLKTLLILSLLSVTLSSCVTTPPKWYGKIWAGDSASQSIQRAQDKEAIACNDPSFDGYLCISGPDFQSFYNTYVLGCKEWKEGVQKMTAEEAMERFKELKAIGAIR